MPFNLSNKVALVSGAASGIGAAIALCLSRAGARVFVADVDEDRGQAQADTLLSEGGKAEFVKLDVSSSEDCDGVAEKVLSQCGHLDILVNNAGIGHVGNILQTPESEFDRLYKVNVKGVFALSKAFLPSMTKRGQGSIINLASIGGLVAVKDRFAYCATKFAVVGMTKSMALDLASTGVRVNCICPGRVETPFVTQRIQEYPDPVKAREEMISTQPLGRMGQPEEIAYAALYLASDEAAFVTGSSLSIDGGWIAG